MAEEYNPLNDVLSRISVEEPTVEIEEEQQEDTGNPLLDVLNSTVEDIPEEFKPPKPKEVDTPEAAQMEENLSFAELASDSEYMSMLRDYNASRFGEDGAQKEDETDEEYLKRFLTHAREFEFNSIDLGRQLDWVRNADEEERIQFGYIYSQLDRLPSFYEEGGTGYISAVRDYGKSLVLDPLNYIGFGVGKVASFAATKAITQALKQGGKQAALKEAAKYSGKRMLSTRAGKAVGLGIAAEAGAASVQDLKLQNLEMLSQKYGEYTEEDYDYGRAALVGGLGLALGAGGAKLSGGLGGKKLLSNAREARIKQNKINKDLNAREAGIKKKANEEAVKRSAEATSQTATGIIDYPAGREALDQLGEIATDAEFAAQVTFRKELMKRVGKVVTEVVQDLADNGQLASMVDADTKAHEVIGKIVKDALESSKTAQSADDVAEQTKKMLLGTEETQGALDVLNNVSGELLEGAISRAGLTPKQFVDAMGASYSDAGAVLQTASKVGSIMKSLGKSDPELAAILKENLPSDTMLGPIGKFYDIMRRLDRERRALMVSQPATTIRNIATGVVRLGFESAADAIESTIYQIGRGFDAAMTGNASLGSGSWKDIVRDSTGRLNRLMSVTDTQMLSESLLKHNPRLASRIDRSLQEVSDDETLSAFTRMANGLNITQDIFFRRAIFTNHIDKKLRRAGVIIDNPTKIGQYKNLEEFVASGKAVPTNLLSEAVEESLDFTFSRMPKPGKSRGDTIGSAFIKFNEALGPIPAPLGTAALPFARFMVNALQFQFNYSPVSTVSSMYRLGMGANAKRLAKAAEKAGDFDAAKKMSKQAASEFDEARSSFSKGVVGTAALIAAINHRAKNQDVKFYEYKNDDGTTSDLRPFFPLTPYLAIADLIVKLGGTEIASLGLVDQPEVVQKLDVMEIVEAFTGAQFRTGASSYITENFASLLDGEDSLTEQRIYELGGGYFGELFGGFLTPARVVRDVQAAYDDEAAKVRDPNQVAGLDSDTRFYNAMVNKIAKDMPDIGLGLPSAKDLPELQSPTRGGPVYRMSPLIGQVTGLRREDVRNPAEEEFVRLGIKSYQLIPGSGDKEADAMVKEAFGPIMERELAVYISSDNYQKLSENKKRVALNNRLKLYRKQAKTIAQLEARADKVKGYNPFDRAEYSSLTQLQTKLADEYYVSKYGKSPIEMHAEDPDKGHLRLAANIGRVLSKRAEY